MGLFDVRNMVVITSGFPGEEENRRSVFPG